MYQDDTFFASEEKGLNTLESGIKQIVNEILGD